MSGTPEAPVRRSWLRRNLLPLVVIATVIPALAFVLVGLPLIEEQRQDGRVEHISQGESAEADGYRFTLTNSKEFVGLGLGDDGNDIPIGLSLVGVVLEVEALDDANPAGSCDAKLMAEVDGEELTWSEVGNPLDFSYGVGEERSKYCLFEGESFEYEVVFLTPTGSYDDATFALTGADGDDFYDFRFDLVKP